MDLHAWFEAYLGGNWYTFDATQEFTTGGRAVLAYGRDAADVATTTYLETFNWTVCLWVWNKLRLSRFCNIEGIIQQKFRKKTGIQE